MSSPTLMARAARLAVLAGTMLISGCRSAPAPMPTVPHVDLARFMGSWYVIANIPTFIERGAHNAVESYELQTDGSIQTTFTFRDGSFTGKRKEYRPRGFVVDTASNALWGMRFVWPIKADYRITWLKDDYSQTIISRQKRDYVWIMARSPLISDEDYKQLLQRVAAQGYDTSLVKRVPQSWPEASTTGTSQ